MKAEQYLKEVLEIENQSIIVDAMETWCRIQIENHIESIRENPIYTDGSIDLEATLNNTPINLD